MHMPGVFIPLPDVANKCHFNKNRTGLHNPIIKEKGNFQVQLIPYELWFAVILKTF